MKKLYLILTISLLLSNICLAQTNTSKLAKCRKTINEINAMDLKQVKAHGEYNIGFVYFDANGLIRKNIYRYSTEIEQLTFISLYDEAGNAVFIAYQAGNNITDEKGFVYLDKGEIILENSVTYPYYEEYYIDEKLVVEGEKGGFTAKTSGTFSYQTPLHEIPLYQYANTDSLKKYCKNYGHPIELLSTSITTNFSNTDLGYITSCNSDGIRIAPNMSASILEGINTDFVHYVTILEKVKGEEIEGWGFNYWYKVKCGEEIGYIYGAFLEPL